MMNIFERLDSEYAHYGCQMLMQSEVDDILSKLPLKDISNTKTILIVDDAAFIRKVEKEILTEHGYLVVGEACDGEEAIEKYKIHRPDLVIMNVTMPIMDGIESTSEIIKFDKEAKIVMFSGISNYQTIKDSILAGACDFIVEKLQMDRFTNTRKFAKKTNNKPSKHNKRPEHKAHKAHKTKESDNKIKSNSEITKVIKFDDSIIKSEIDNNRGEKSIWLNNFKVLDIESPNAIINQQVEDLAKLTEGYVLASFDSNKNELSEFEFEYKFDIAGPKLNNYTFYAFSIAYDIGIYPCHFFINKEIANEVKLPDKIIANNEKEVLKILKKILQSHKVNYTISTLMTLSKNM